MSIFNLKHARRTKEPISAEVATEDSYQEEQRTRERRIAEQDRLETKRINDAQEQEMASFRTNIAEVKVLRDIGNTVQIGVIYKLPIRTRSEIIHQDNDFENDWFGALSRSR
ncbi:MAG: hypothetical protein ACREBU_03765 [Nitrososphaera sp.]